MMSFLKSQSRRLARMEDVILNMELWAKSLEQFVTLYLREPESTKDYARVSSIYNSKGGKFAENIIPKSIEDNLMKEGVFDVVKATLGKIFKNPILVGIALYFLAKLYKKTSKTN